MCSGLYKYKGLGYLQAVCRGLIISVHRHCSCDAALQMCPWQLLSRKGPRQKLRLGCQHASRGDGHGGALTLGNTGPFSPGLLSRCGPATTGAVIKSAGEEARGHPWLQVDHASDAFRSGAFLLGSILAAPPLARGAGDRH